MGIPIYRDPHLYCGKCWTAPQMFPGDLISGQGADPFGVWFRHWGVNMVMNHRHKVPDKRISPSRGIWESEEVRYSKESKKNLGSGKRNVHKKAFQPWQTGQGTY